MLEKVSTDLVQECKRRLLSQKQDLLNRLKTSHFEMSAHDKMAGDEADQCVAQLAENSFLANFERIRFQLLEIESALGRIENGQFGICEETSEPIEANRLLAIPYTRLSIEGAEIREAVAQRYAR